MTDIWFLQDIEHLLKPRNRVVLLDPRGQSGFLLPLLDKKGYKILRTDPKLTEQWQTVKEELMLRYETETAHKDTPVVFYVTREQEELSFLFDYCFTHGCLDLSNPTEWLKGKSIDQALAIDNMDIVEELALPPVKIHCSVLAEDAIKAAIKDYQVKNGLLEAVHA